MLKLVYKPEMGMFKGVYSHLSLTFFPYSSVLRLLDKVTPLSISGNDCAL